MRVSEVLVLGVSEVCVCVGCLKCLCESVWCVCMGVAQLFNMDLARCVCAWS